MGERVRGPAGWRYRANVTAPPYPFGTPRDWAIDLAVATAIGAFLGLIGPFGSYLNGSVGLRVFHWVVSLWIGTLFLGGAVRVAVLAAARLGFPLWFTIGAATVLADIPFAALVWMMTAVEWPELKGRFTPVEWYLQVVTISIPLAAVYGFARFRRAEAESPHLLEAETAPADAERIVTPVLCLQMEDHYVRVHGAEGSRLVHSTLSQAIANLGPVEGMQVHRSWWVARGAVARAAPDGRNLKLVLTNGLSVPVSRSAVARLRAAGWIDG